MELNHGKHGDESENHAVHDHAVMVIFVMVLVLTWNMKSRWWILVLICYEINCMKWMHVLHGAPWWYSSSRVARSACGTKDQSCRHNGVIQSYKPDASYCYLSLHQRTAQHNTALQWPIHSRTCFHHNHEWSAAAKCSSSATPAHLDAHSLRLPPTQPLGQITYF